MRDPFTFDPARATHERAGAYCGEDRGHDVLCYHLPCGQVLERILPIHSSKWNLDRKFAMEDLRYTFDRLVSGLSAHQRIAWMAAAHQEKTDV